MTEITGPIHLRDDWKHSDGKAHTRLVDSWDAAEGVHTFGMKQWDTIGLGWVKFTGIAGGGGGAGDASAANQVLELAKLTSIDTKLTGVALDGTDIIGAAMPLGGVGIRGWLSAIYGRLIASIAVTGTFWQATQPVSIAAAVAVTGAFWQATQPVSLATNTPDVTDRSGRLLGIIASITSAVDISDRVGRLLGHVTVDNASLAVTGPATDAQLRANPLPISGTVAVSNMIPAVETGLAKDASLAALATGANQTLELAQLTTINADLGALSSTPGAYTVLDRLNQIAKTTATEATMQKVLAALKPVPAIAARSTTLLHR